jgi:hypothetical protein
MRKYRLRLRLLTGIWWIIRRNRKPDLSIEMRRIDLLSTSSGTVQWEDMPMHSFSLCDSSFRFGTPLPQPQSCSPLLSSPLHNESSKLRRGSVVAEF